MCKSPQKIKERTHLNIPLSIFLPLNTLISSCKLKFYIDQATTHIMIQNISTIAILLSLLFIQETYGFGCEIATTSSKCGSMRGCSWSSPTCTGTYNPWCSSWNCLFVYPRGASPTSPRAGNAADPFKYFDEAIRAAGTGDVDIHMVGDDVEPNPVAGIADFSTITSKTTRIKPLYSGMYFTIDFSLVFEKIAN